MIRILTDIAPSNAVVAKVRRLERRRSAASRARRGGAEASTLRSTSAGRMFCADDSEIGPDLFRHGCLMGLEGLVSKHRDSTYRGGRFDRWVKVKNRAASGF